MKLNRWSCSLYIKTMRASLLVASLMSFHQLQAEEIAFDASIPVLDMNEYFQADTKDKFVKELYQALHEVGFFAVVNTAVDAQVLDAGYQACFDFFTLPKEEKLQAFNLSVNGQRGYIAGESAKGAAKGDFKEFYHVGRERDAEELKAIGILPNIWPKDFDLKSPLVNLFDALEKYKVPLEMAMAEAIGMPSDFFTKMTENGDVLLRAIHYPANPPKDAVWAAEHTDIDLFTILPCATAEGLQIKNKEGLWIDVKVPKNAFIVNGGDMLENVTNGEFHSGLHRVVAKGDGYERYSIVFFVHPRAQDRLDPLPDCIKRTGGFRKYAHANRLDLLEERLIDLGLASPSMVEHFAQSGMIERLIEVGRASPAAMKKLKEMGLASDVVLSELERLDQ